MAKSTGGTPATLADILAAQWNEQVVVKTRPGGSYFSPSGAPLTPDQYKQAILDQVAPYKANGWPEIDVQDAVVNAAIDADVAKYAAVRVGWAVVVFDNKVAPWQVDARKELGIPADLGVDKDA